MSKPLDLFDSLQQDAAQTIGQPPDVQQVVGTALVANHVPRALQHELAPMAMVLKVPSARIEKALAEAMNLVSSKPFLLEMSKEIGTPLMGETEDDFVTRAKEIIRKLLEKLLR